MRIVEQKKEYVQLEKLFDGLLRRNKRLPEALFSNKYPYKSITPFDVVMEGGDRQCLYTFLRSCDVESYYLGSLDPDPVEYFLHYSGFYATFELFDKVIEQDLSLALTYCPEGTKYKTMVIDADRVLFVPKGLEWCIYFDREYELSLAAFENADLKKRFDTAFSKYLINSYDSLKENLIIPNIDHDDVKTLFENYFE